MIKKIILSSISLANTLYPKSTNRVLFISSPDLTDNSFALFKYLIENYSDKYHFTWLLHKPDQMELYHKMIRENISITEDTLSKVHFKAKNSLIGFLSYFRAKHIFFTHGFYTGIGTPKSQLRINLWHAMPLKSIGHLNQHGDKSTIPDCSYTIATSKLFQNIMAQVFALPKEKVLLAGQPRYDLLTQDKDCLKKLGINKKTYNKILFWAPTFRRAIGKQMKDGDFHEGLPIIDLNDLADLNQYLETLNTFLLIKLHPMDILNLKSFTSMTHIKIIKNQSLLDTSCQLYSLLTEMDILITDFSSIYIDFLLQKKPILFLAEDFDNYAATRGFVFDNPKQYMPGHFITQYDTLKKVLSDLIVDHNDPFKNDRIRIMNLFHKQKTNFSSHLLELLNMK